MEGDPNANVGFEKLTGMSVLGASCPFRRPAQTAKPDLTHCGRSLVVALFFADYVGGHVTSSIQEIMVSIEGGRSGAGDGTVRLCRKSPRLSSM